MHRFPSLPFLLASVVLLRLAGFAAPAHAGEPVRQYTDESTAATITVAEVSLVFANERTDLAVNARDYLSLGPIEINRSGQRSYFWFGYLWSTIDHRDGSALALPEDQFILIADGRPIALVRDAKSLRERGIAEQPVHAPKKGAALLLFPADPEVFNYVRNAGHIELRHVRQEVSETYSIWRDSRDSLEAFLRHLELDQP